jgi:pectate lyase
MKIHPILLSTCISTSLWSQSPIGWASVTGEGRTGTTGGAGGQTVTVTTEAAFAQAAANTAPLIIRIQGTIVLANEIRPASHKTIEGAGPGARLEGSLTITGSSSARLQNVIVRNLIIRKTGGTGEDAISIRRAHHVWVDHCDLADSPDGLLDVTNGSDFITLSWNKISYASSTAAHRFAMLFGNSDGAGDEDSTKLKITLHHNWFAQNVIERMPRIRFGQIHIFNNYYNSPGNNYCVGAGYQAQALVQNNHFDGSNDPHIFYSAEPTARIATAYNGNANGNCYSGVSNTTAKETGQGTVFTPPYAFTAEPCASVRGSVTAAAGPQFGATPIRLPGLKFGIRLPNNRVRDFNGRKLRAYRKAISPVPGF